MARSWNGSQAHNSGRANMEVGSFKDQRHDWRPSYMRTMPSLSISDQNQQNNHRQSNRKLDLTGEMIFGTAPLAYKGMNTKVHYYKRDKNPQIIISKLFTLNNTQSQQQRDLDITRRTSFSSVNSDRSTTSFTANSSVCDDNISEQSSDDDHFSTASIYPPVLGLYQSTKRTRRFSQTNMENGVFSPTPLPTTRISAIENPVRQQTSRSVKFAVAIIITLEDKNETLYDFIFSHFALIENRLHQLQAIAFKQLYQYFKNHPPHSYLQPRKRSSTLFLSPNTFQKDPVLIDAANQFKTYFFDLYETPRIQEPLWLNMSTYPQRKSDYEASLIKELMQLVHQFDNKSHNYFISTLLTGVLMHHLSWVNTVAPPEANTHIGCHHGNYDPLWAQLSDLYGFIGTPSRITRTIVVGLRPSVVKRILYILSYFIRCNEVYENTESRTKSMLTTSTSSESIFSNELDDTNSEHKFEDKIVRHLTGDVESIAIPKNNHHVAYASSSIESTNSIKSSSKWFSDTDERPWSPDPFVVVSSSSSSLEVPSLTMSPTGSYHVAMPKSTVTHMEPDITQESNDVPNTRIDRLFAKSYGRSLMASYCDTYKSDFVLMGIPTLPATSVLDADLRNTLEQFTLSDSVSEASCLVIDTNNFKCRVLNHRLPDTVMDPPSLKKAGNSWQVISMSNIVYTMLSDMRQIYEDNNGDLSCAEQIMNLMEDNLQLIYLHSTMLQDIVQEAVQNGDDPLSDTASLANDLKLNQNDIPLLLNVCSTYDTKMWDLQRNAYGP
ncbi:folliculin-interacting protein middle domain-containing protein [Mucor mucedo]|uniref:folliculin-interacting protein middle domain-containing protein n=1 Tax=Mucor mucedo TaxID=29922 RepID=UPI00221F9984|nr:folliculin-interacting protein middle domain-containing protein [Mucor mucedo]KAI7875535.1 folliculin-interacting protein middle domain-containing protein [Mucor mucedo]